jgi:hypothetical protein
LALPWICSTTQAQADTTFKPTDQFAIPAYNGTISFATFGTYTSANLENDTWNFVNLSLNSSQQLENISVSAQNSNITITGYQIFDTVVSNSTLRRSALLSYTVVGQGRQTFNFDRILHGGGWSVSFNGNFVGENDGWSLSPDQTLTMTGATANVTIVYFNFSNSFGGNGNNSNQPFYQQHSVAIATGVSVAIVAVLTFAIKRKNKTKESVTIG